MRANAGKAVVYEIELDGSVLRLSKEAVDAGASDLSLILPIYVEKEYYLASIRAFFLALKTQGLKRLDF